MNKLRIAFLSPFQLRLRRGIETSAQNLALHLAQLGHEIAFFCWSGERQPAPQLKHYIMPEVRYFEAYWAGLFYTQVLLRFKPDVVVLFFADYGEASALKMLCRIQKTALVFVAGYPFELVPHRFQAFKSAGLDQHLSAIVVKAPHMRPDLEVFFNRPVDYIPNGVDTEFFKPIPRHVDSTYRLITVAALEQRKGFEPILAALPDIVARFSGLCYSIVGAGPDEAWLREQIQTRKLTDVVDLVGAVEDVRPYLASSDLFLLPAYGEGLPNAYLEALATGLPTLVSSDPPFDTIAKPEFSLQIDRHDPASISRAVIDLLNDPERRTKMGNAARQAAESRYSWHTVAAQYEALFAKVITFS